VIAPPKVRLSSRKFIVMLFPHLPIYCGVVCTPTVVVPSVWGFCRRPASRPSALPLSSFGLGNVQSLLSDLFV
ncbi:UNVERIFIED_CONTAM: hypothetical protein Sindi_0466600, partial [Sesamum indicum]